MLTASTIVIDAIPPTILKVTSANSNGYYTTGTINVKIQFSEVVVLTGTPTLQLNTGGSNPILNGALNLNESLVDFTYTVAVNDENVDLNYLTTTSLVGTFSDGKGNTVTNPALPELSSRNSLAGNKNLYVDAKKPVVLDVTSPNATGTYYIDNVIYIKVNFDDKVKVSGKPTIVLNSGGTAIYYSGSNSNILQFKYVVASGDAAATLNYSGSIVLGTGSIKDLAGNEATLTLNGSSLNSKGITVDGSLKSAEIAYASITSISESNQNAKFNVSVYPNPSINGEIVLNFSGNANSKQVEIQIYNIVGNLISSDKIQISNKVVLQKQLESGIYIMSVLKDNEVYNQRIMVE
jgi:hypothetical protein